MLTASAPFVPHRLSPPTMPPCSTSSRTSTITVGCSLPRSLLRVHQPVARPPSDAWGRRTAVSQSAHVRYEYTPPLLSFPRRSCVVAPEAQLSDGLNGRSARPVLLRLRILSNPQALTQFFSFLLRTEQ